MFPHCSGYRLGVYDSLSCLLQDTSPMSSSRLEHKEGSKWVAESSTVTDVKLHSHGPWKLASQTLITAGHLLPPSQSEQVLLF